MLDLLLRVGRVGVPLEVPEEVPVVGVHNGFGQLRESEEEEEPGPAELVRVVQTLRELPRMGCVEDRQPVHDLWVLHRGGPGGGSAPVVADHQRRFGATFVDQAPDVVRQHVGVVGSDVVRAR
jgi:hypothetical protein